MKLDIRYRCSFEYDSLVRESQNELRAAPISDDRQSVLSYKVTSFPAARFFSFEDYWGTRVDAFGVREPHIYIEVIAEATVETHPSPMLTASADFARLQDLDFLADHFEYLERTPHVDWDDAIGAEARRQIEIAGTDVVSTVLAIHRRAGVLLSYQPGTTYVGVPVTDLIARGAGVCQDYAHLAVAMCRSVGIPARYVSGYVHPGGGSQFGPPVGETVPGESHAWVEWWDDGWRAFDPSHGSAVDDRYVTVATGRDYGDVRPLAGIYSGARTSRMSVAVEVTRLA